MVYITFLGAGSVVFANHHLGEYLPYFWTDHDLIDDLTPEEEFGHDTIERPPTGR